MHSIQSASDTEAFLRTFVAEFLRFSRLENFEDLLLTIFTIPCSTTTTLISKFRPLCCFEANSVGKLSDLQTRHFQSQILANAYL